MVGKMRVWIPHLVAVGFHRVGGEEEGVTDATASGSRVVWLCYNVSGTSEVVSVVALVPPYKIQAHKSKTHAICREGLLIGNTGAGVTEVTLPSFTGSSSGAVATEAKLGKWGGGAAESRALAPTQFL